MKKKILIVDDNPSIIRLLTLRLEANDYDVCVAYDGEDCVKIAQIEVPDLILLDIGLPHGNGIRAFEQLIQSEITKSIPVIFMTAYPSIQVKRKVMNMGANGFISKPFTSKDFNQTIETVLDKYDRF